MSQTQTTLQRFLLGGAVYFLLVSAAHMVGVKVPLLFVYFSVPSYAYQDRIISFLSFGWAMFLLSGVSGVKRGALESVRYILWAGSAGVVGLCVINFTLGSGAASRWFWVETALLFFYLVLLARCYHKAAGRNSSSTLQR